MYHWNLVLAVRKEAYAVCHSSTFDVGLWNFSMLNINQSIGKPSTRSALRALPGRVLDAGGCALLQQTDELRGEAAEVDQDALLRLEGAEVLLADLQGVQEEQVRLAGQVHAQRLRIERETGDSNSQKPRKGQTLQAVGNITYFHQTLEQDFQNKTIGYHVT